MIKNVSDEECLKIVFAAIRDISGVDSLGADQDFYNAGVTSVQALPLLMELEARFDVTIPDDRFVAARSAAGLYAVIREIKET